VKLWGSNLLSTCGDALFSFVVQFRNTKTSSSSEIESKNPGHFGKALLLSFRDSLQASTFEFQKEKIV
jgi:hypothetical protein